MKLAIMQPYFFPYIGYWQLMNAVDRYVIYNDVNYIARGWINRNRILVQGVPQYIHLPLQKASQNKRIDEIRVLHDERSLRKTLRTIELAYRRAPQFPTVFPLVQSILSAREENLALWLRDQLQAVAAHLGIKTELLLSSELHKDNSLRGQAKILAICRELGATEYYNAIGGRALYDRETFAQNSIELHFLRAGPITYQQFGGAFQENLSIVDMLMFNTTDEIRASLNVYTLE